MNSENRNDILESEHGAGTFLAMIFCLAAIFGYLKGGREYLVEHLDPIYHMVVVIGLVVIAMFTIGCTVHLMLKGDRSTRRLRREMQKETEELEKFVLFARGRLDYLDEEASQQHAALRPQGKICLTMAKRIVNAIERRAHELNKLLVSKNKFDIIDAHELLHSKLEIVENCVDSLIAGDPIKPLPRSDWFNAVDRLISEVDVELERAAA